MTFPSSDPIIFTDNAAAKVWELIKEVGNFNLKLRVFVTGGGCSGLRYDFTFDEAAQPDDIKVTKSISSNDENAEEGEEGEGSASVQLLVDPFSFHYLAGAKIDYKADIEGEQFIIHNPQAKTTCGCGSSFAV